MGIVRKQSFYASLLMYISMVVGYINLIVLMPKYFTQAEVGMTRSILTIAVAFCSLTELGTSSIIFRFLPVYRSQRAKDFVNIISLIPLSGFIIFCSIFYIFKDSWFASYFESSPELKHYLPLIIYLTFFTLIGSVATSYSVANLKTIFPKAINELIPKIGNTLLILMYSWHWINFDQYFFWFCSLTFISSVFIVLYLLQLGLLKFDSQFSSLTQRLSRSMLKYGLIAILGNSFTAIINYIDVLMLGGMKGQSDVASFSVGFYIISIMSVPFTSIITVVNPLVASAIRHKRWNEVLRHYRQTSLNNFIIGGFIFIVLLLTFEDILRIIPNGTAYYTSYFIIIFLGLGRLFDMITGCNAEIIVLSKYYAFNLYSIIAISIIKILANYYLIDEYGMWGVGISGLICLILFNISRYFYIWKKLHIQPFTVRTLYAICLVFLCWIFCWIIFQKMDLSIQSHMYASLIIQLVIKTLIISVIFIPILLMLKISPEMNNFYQLISSKFLFSKKS